MARSRHGHRVAPVEGGGLPSWAQRHLGEAGEADEALTVATPSPSPRRRRAAAPPPAHRLKGWGVAVVSVAAAVGAVPLAISSVAADRSDDPLPTVNTFTAGAPGPLESGGAAEGGVAQGGTRTVPAPPGDPSTGGILEDPAGAAVPGRAVVGPAVPVPRAAAVVRPTVPAAASSTTTAPARPLAGTSTTTPKPAPTTTTGGGDDDGDGRAATKPTTPAKPPASSSGSGGSGGGDSSPGLVGGLVNTTDKVVGGAGKVVGGLL